VRKGVIAKMTAVENEMKMREDFSAVRSRNLKKKGFRFVPRFGCLRLDFDSPTLDTRNEDGSVDMVSAGPDEEQMRRDPPTHLLIMVNGIIGK